MGAFRLNRRVLIGVYVYRRLACLVLAWASVLSVLPISHAAGEELFIGGPEKAGSSATFVANVTGSELPAGKLGVADSHLPKAKSIDLEMPVEGNGLVPIGLDDAVSGESFMQGQSEHSALAMSATIAPPLVMLGTEVPPVTSARLSWSPDQSFEGLASPTPVLVVNGAKAGPTLCLTAAIHGDELNGIEIVRRVLYAIEPQALSGAVIGVPIVNLQGFQRRSRYLTDRRDLNRHFPGSPTGSSAARIAHSFFNEVIRHCSILVDIHTGSFDRTNLLQLRADLANPQVVALTEGFGATVVLHNAGAEGTLRRASVDNGTPAITLEVGGPMRLQQDEVEQSVESIQTLLDHLHMVKSSRIWGTPEPVYYRSQWLRADVGGILLSQVELGEKVSSGDVLGFVTNPITNVRTEIRAPTNGRILGMALDQVVLPGYAAYHIGISGEVEEIPEETGVGLDLLSEGVNGDGSTEVTNNRDEASDSDARDQRTISLRADHIMAFD
ncbi:MAG: succinylglutamate desuccinylase/aspartoacylase family protein [Halioglobus sp.]|nr:succinylglutamate desuccinylase/aspartoacylase family protein [Halioglobus sp.]